MTKILATLIASSVLLVAGHSFAASHAAAPAASAAGKTEAKAEVKADAKVDAKAATTAASKAAEPAKAAVTDTAKGAVGTAKTAVPAVKADAKVDAKATPSQPPSNLPPHATRACNAGPCCLSCRERFSRLPQRPAQEQHLGEAQLGQVAHAGGVEAANQVVAFVLHHAGMEAVHRAVQRVAIQVEPGVADARPARHQPAQTGHRQAAFPTVFFSTFQRCDHRVDEHCARHHRRVRVTRVGGVGAKNHHLEVHTDLRRGQTGAAGGVHGVHHVGHQGVQCIGVEFGHRLRHPQQPGVAHLEDVTDGHASMPFKVSSSITATPSSRALSSLLPAASPASR